MHQDDTKMDIHRPVPSSRKSVWVNTTEVLTERQPGGTRALGTRRVKADFVLVWWCVRYW